MEALAGGSLLPGDKHQPHFCHLRFLAQLTEPTALVLSGDGWLMDGVPIEFVNGCCYIVTLHWCLSFGQAS